MANNYFDPVEAARRRQQAMLSRSSYFPAANLRQFEGTELSPPGGGTYFKPSAYTSGGWSGKQYYGSELRNIQKNLAQQWQSDLAFNAMANPRMARGLEAERIGAQYASGSFGSGRATPATSREYYAKNTIGINNGLRTIELPSGGTATIRDSSSYGGTIRPPSLSPALAQSNLRTAYQKGYGAPAPTVQGGYLNQGGVQTPVENLTAQQRSQYGVPTFGERIGQFAGGLQQVGTLGYNALASLGRMFGGGGNAATAGQGAGSPVTPPQNASYYANYNPSPQPRRYFDYY